jgi:fumarate hydratase subunit beta
MSAVQHINLNSNSSDIKNLRIGDLVTISGSIHVTIGIPVHKHLIECIKENDLSVCEEMKGGCFFHLSTYVEETSTGQKPLYINPSTSTRYNEWMPDLIDGFNLKMVGGKGGLDQRSVDQLTKNGCVYLSFLGGGSPFLSKGLKRVINSRWNNYISQFRLLTLEVDHFGPATVAIDSTGNSIYGNLISSAEGKLDSIMNELNTQRNKFIDQFNLS